MSEFANHSEVRRIARTFLRKKHQAEALLHSINDEIVGIIHDAQAAVTEANLAQSEAADVELAISTLTHALNTGWKRKDTATFFTKVSQKAHALLRKKRDLELRYMKANRVHMQACRDYARMTRMRARVTRLQGV